MPKTDKKLGKKLKGSKGRRLTKEQYFDMKKKQLEDKLLDKEKKSKINGTIGKELAPSQNRVLDYPSLDDE